ncbi:MAG: acyl-CoA thioesterase [Acaryochloridaceae cyanobacterium CSU_3_4]|nr:acyl-CoA thioesterase [Acaryochloridaceae cyanobacterium CSU_3_4]
MNPIPTQSSPWFEYYVHVQPRHTDYAGVVWHGSCLEWMEAARIAAFRTVGLEYSELVQVGCDLPVIDVSVRYQKVIKMGEVAIVKSRISRFEKVRLYWDQQVFCADDKKPCIVGEVTLVPVQSESGRILRRLPQLLQDAVDKILC